MRNIISLKNISKTFDKGTPHAYTALNDISFEVRGGEFFILIGRSGSGKSTLLRIMSGLEKDFDGTLTLAPDLTKNHISFVFQQFAIMPWMTVFENVEMGLLALEPSAEKRKRRVNAELERFHLEESAHLRPRELSGGMRQRVGFARALARDPKVIFLDEPFSELDSFIAEELRAELLRIWEEQSMTIIMVSHNTPETVELADRIAVIKEGGYLKGVVENTLARPRILRSEPAYHLEDRLAAMIK